MWGGNTWKLNRQRNVYFLFLPLPFICFTFFSFLWNDRIQLTFGRIFFLSFFFFSFYSKINSIPYSSILYVFEKYIKLNKETLIYAYHKKCVRILTKKHGELCKFDNWECSIKMDKPRMYLFFWWRERDNDGSNNNDSSSYAFSLSFSIRMQRSQLFP